MKKFALMLIALLFVLLSGCKESNPVEQEEHFEPEGWLFENLNEIPVLVVWRAEIQSEWNNNSLSNRFTVGINDSVLIKTRFLDSSGLIMEYPQDQEYSLGWLLANNIYADISPDPVDRWSFWLRGVSSGSTTVEMRVLHGGHADVITPLISIDVQ
jgi:hypothetical protein